MQFLDKIRKVQDKFLILKTTRDNQIQKMNKLIEERDELIKNIDIRVETINFVEKVATVTRENVKNKVEELITSCLREVYDDSYSIVFDYGVKNNKTSVQIFITRKCSDGMVIKRSIDGMGGGVADTVSLPLKLIVLMNDNTSDKVLIADEPGKHLDKERVVKFGKLLKEISDKLGIQIIMSTHHDSLSDFSDNIHRITLNDSVSVVERIK